MSLADEVERLAALHERGALTDEEFARLKVQLIEAGASGSSIGNASGKQELAVNRLRRSSSDRWLGGVCGGLAEQTTLVGPGGAQDAVDQARKPCNASPNSFPSS